MLVGFKVLRQSESGSKARLVSICVIFFRGCPQAPGYGDIRLSLEVIPDTVNLEEPFQIVCKITNCR